MIRTYTDLASLDTLEERFAYLRLGGVIGAETFGYDRWMSQKFYKSREWRQARTEVIARDLGHDLAHPDWFIRGNVLIHHMNPLTPHDIIEGTDNLIDPEYLVTVSHQTHNAIHYGDESLLPRVFVERQPGDTRFW